MDLKRQQVSSFASSCSSPFMNSMGVGSPIVNCSMNSFRIWRIEWTVIWNCWRNKQISRLKWLKFGWKMDKLCLTTVFLWSTDWCSHRMALKSKIHFAWTFHSSCLLDSNLFGCASVDLRIEYFYISLDPFERHECAFEAHTTAPSINL